MRELRQQDGHLDRPSTSQPAPISLNTESKVPNGEISRLVFNEIR
jgi:hypothetical protein